MTTLLETSKALESTSLDESMNCEAKRNEEIETQSDKAKVEDESENMEEVVAVNVSSNSPVPQPLSCTQSELKAQESLDHPTATQSGLNISEPPAHLKSSQSGLNELDSPAHPTGTKSELNAQEPPAHPIGTQSGLNAPEPPAYLTSSQSGLNELDSPAHPTGTKSELNAQELPAHPIGTQSGLNAPEPPVQSTSIQSGLNPQESPVYPTGAQSELNEREPLAQPTALENFRLILAGSGEQIHTVETNKRRKVELVAPITGPSIYDIEDDCNFISPPLIPGRLPEAFESLPVFGEPGSAELDKTKLLRDFVGGDLDEDEFDKLGMYCSTEHLRTGDEISMPTAEPCTGFSAAVAIKEHLASSAYHSGAGASLQTLRKYNLVMTTANQHIYSRKRKYRGVRFFKVGEPKGRDDDQQDPLVPGKDLMFRVRIYRPFSYSPRERKRQGSRHPLFMCDLVLLGRHTLAELRDRIDCVNDRGLRLDVSDRPDHEPHTNCKELFPSGFLFINNVFYNDRRPGCSDYSAPIREWAQKRNMGEFRAEDMGAVRLDQLTIRLGYPEVYVHQGSCEHLFTFSEVRLVGLGDPRRPALYPRHYSATGYNCLYCTTCAEYPANWVVTGSLRVPFDPALFCATCLKLYMYVDGRKCGDFKAVRYKGNEMETVPA